MLIKRKDIRGFEDFYEKISSKKFDINTQYKLIKIHKAIKDEEEIYQEQLQINCEPYFEKDELGNPIINEHGGYKIQQEKMAECYFLMTQMNNLDVQIPDIYFTLDELEKLELTLEEMEILLPFIK